MGEEATGSKQNGFDPMSIPVAAVVDTSFMTPRVGDCSFLVTPGNSSFTGELSPEMRRVIPEVPINTGIGRAFGSMSLVISIGLTF